MSSVPSSKQPTYDYYLPKDHAELKRDSITNGVITCTRDHDQAPNVTKEAIQEQVYAACLQLKDSTKKDIFTNDFEQLSRSTIYYFTESYLRTRTLFEADPQTFEAAKFYLKSSTSDVLHYLSNHLTELGEAL